MEHKLFPPDYFKLLVKKEHDFLKALMIVTKGVFN